MANHASAEKRNRQRIKRTDRNRAVKRALRTAVKKARAAVEAGDKTVAEPAVQAAALRLAHAVSKGVVHKNTAARTTSRIHKALTKLA